MSVSQSSNGLSLSELSPVAAGALSRPSSRKGPRPPRRSGNSRPSSRKGRRGRVPRRSPISSLGKQVAVLCRTVICNEDRDERGGPIRKDDKVFYRAARTQKTVHTLFGPVRYFRTRSEKESFSPVDNDLGLIDGYLTNPAASLLLLEHCTPQETAKLFGELGGMNPSSSHASVGDDGQPLEGKGAGSHGKHPRGGNGARRFPAPFRLTGFRFARTETRKRAGARRPAGRSVSRTRKAIA